MTRQKIVDYVVSWAIDVANDPAHGYDQANRWGPDYDCSSFVITAWQSHGVPVKTKGALCTADMVAPFLKCGFVDITSQVNFKTGAGLIPGDVVWKRGHTEMCCGANGQLVGASLNENGEITGGWTGDQTGKEIRVRSYYNKPWTKALRFPVDGSGESGGDGGGGSEGGGTGGDGGETGGEYDPDIDDPELDEDFWTDEGWVAQDRPLTLEEMEINARYIYSYLSNRYGWSDHAIAAVLGNMERASTINPYYCNNWSFPPTQSYGLVSWSPPDKFADWAGENWYRYHDKQLERLEWELLNGVQYVPQEPYAWLNPFDFRYTADSEQGALLAAMFAKCYIGYTSQSTYDDVGNKARYWFGKIQSWKDTPEPHPGYEPFEKLPAWLLFKLKE